MPDFENMSPEQMQKMMEQMRKKEEEGLTPEQIEEQRKKKEEEKQRNIALANENLSYCKSAELGRSREELSEILVYLPDEIAKLKDGNGTEPEKPCAFSCENADALSLAEKKVQDPAYKADGSEGRLLLLNLASATRPGGRVFDGANGQEEDLCRRSTLLLSLQSEEAKRFYDYNNSLHTQLGSDAVMITPDVAVVRDAKGELLEAPYYLSVMSCSAPMVRMGFEGKTEEEYHALLLNRIEGMLRCAASLGYRNLILGAFGCGAFGNDAALVSDTFYRALTGPAGRGFYHADFAVLCTPGKEYNYQEFCRNFGGNKEA